MPRKGVDPIRPDASMWVIEGEDEKGLFVAVIAVEDGICGLAPGGFDWAEGLNINDVVEESRKRGWKCLMAVPPARGSFAAGSQGTSDGSTSSTPSTEPSTK